MHLHALFDDCRRKVSDAMSEYWDDLPSNGFITASLAMVAQAPLVAATFSNCAIINVSLLTYLLRADGDQNYYLPWHA